MKKALKKVKRRNKRRNKRRDEKYHQYDAFKWNFKRNYT